MIESVTEFALLGSRDYVNGVTLLSGFLRALEREERGAIKISRLKFQKVARGNGRLVLVRDTALPDAERANCLFTAQAGGIVWRGAFFDENRPIARRPATEYSVSNIRAAGFAGQCDIGPRDRDALIADIVQANKRFHELGVDPAAQSVVRFGYLEDWAAPAPDVAFSGNLKAVNLFTRKTPRGFLTVNRITYGAAGRDAATLTLCFEVEVPQSAEP